MTSDYPISAVIRSHKLPVGLQFFNQETAFLGSSFVRIESAAHAAMVSVCEWRTHRINRTNNDKNLSERETYSQA